MSRVFLIFQLQISINVLPLQYLGISLKLLRDYFGKLSTQYSIYQIENKIKHIINSNAYRIHFCIRNYN